MNTKITETDIDQMLEQATQEHHIFYGKALVVCYQLQSGFILIGTAAVVDPNNFDLEVGLKIAHDNAKNQLWELEGYRLQLELAK